MSEGGDRTHARRRPSLKDHARSALRQRFAERGWSAYRADQVATWLYRQDATSLDEMTNLPASLRGEIAAEFEVETLVVEATQRSVDGTQKLLLRAFDGARIESVLIPEERRHTLCVSTQVGCPLTCSFCATGALGFTRNLSAGEIVDQVLQARRRIPEGEVLTNLVFMGMGEPLLNLPNVSEAIRILVDPKGLALAPRRITVSTAGVLPQIGPLLSVAPIHLAVSLHATTDEVRDVLVPLNKRFPLAALMDALRNEPQLNRRRPVFFEYTLMEGVNDSLEDARRMPRLLAGIPAKVNVIPMNPHADAPYRPPSTAVVDRFTAALHEAGLRVTLRRDRGRDIDAACGQLANRAAASAPPTAAGPEPARDGGPRTRPESLQGGLLADRWGPRDAGAPPFPGRSPAVEAHALRDR
jgi:23S rRNA (adenine2503-C2)-methyltransferase